MANMSPVIFISKVLLKDPTENQAAKEFLKIPPNS